MLVSNSKATAPSDNRTVLPLDRLKELNRRSNLKGLLKFATHLSILGTSGYVWGVNIDRNWAIALLALIIYGFGLASMFAPMHECSHRTAFASNTFNDAIGWIAGVLSLYNLAFFRRYHKWHHRYTQDIDKDPELSDPIPETIGDYILSISGLSWWWGKMQTHTRVASGKLEGYPFIPENARAEIIRSTRWQLTVYGVLALVSIIFRQPWFFVYWLLPLFVGQPILRFVLMAEHTGCDRNDNPFSNTRTTLTLFPVRLMMWDMPFHAEHHLYPSIPFHQLSIAHQELRQYFTKIENGYIKANLEIARNLG
jgi:fatty acid desaturase